MTTGGSYHVSGQVLTMYNLEVTDTDRYTCVARNFAGVTSATTTLKVHGEIYRLVLSRNTHSNDNIAYNNMSTKSNLFL